jgi:hypothetical protein
MPQRVVYGEEHSGLRWPVVAIAILGWVLMIGFGIAMNVPNLSGLGVLASVGGVLAVFYTAFLLNSLADGIRVYEDGIQIGGLHHRDRRLRRGTWPPQKLSAGSTRAVFTCPWQATDGLYLITERSEIKRVHTDVRRYWTSTHGTRMPLGVFIGAAIFASALLVICVDPRRTESEPRDSPTRECSTTASRQLRRRPGWCRSGIPVRSAPPCSGCRSRRPSTITCRRRVPSSSRRALERLPQAPPVYDHLPTESTLQFEVRW